MVPEYLTDLDDPRVDKPSAEEIVALERAKSRALVDLLNDLRTPLMMIKSPLHTKRFVEDPGAAQILNHAKRVQAGIEKAVRILEMDLAETGVGDASVDVANAVDRHVSTLRPLADRRRITVEYSATVSNAIVQMARPRIQHLLETITEKVVESTQGGGCVRFHLAAPGESELVLEVEGSEPLGGNTSSPGVKLGVEIARRHVLQCGGHLVTEKARCRVTLPAEIIAAGPEDPDAGDGAFASYHGSDADQERATPDGKAETKVLIVDDHAGTRAYLRYALRKHHRIIEASDGREGLEMVREHRPDLVISDIMMPVMDGNELCREIKSDDDFAHIPVFLVTANSMPTLKTTSLESGADDYLIKPFDVDEAVMRINNEISSRRKLRRRFSREVVIKPSDITVTSEDEAFLNRAREIVEANMENGDFSVQDLASEMGLSSRQLQRRLREIADQSPVEFIRSLRLQRAAQLLEARYGNVSEVAYRVGFTSLSYFAKCFKEDFGQSPSAFKEHSDAT